jgi:protein SCO1/2
MMRIVLAQVFGLLILVYSVIGHSAQVAANSSLVETEVITLLGSEARTLPKFELIDHHQKTFGKDRLRGKWNLMFFGFTNCPDVCPTTLSEMNSIVKQIPARVRDEVKVYFVSVDPERDKPELLAAYMSYFNPDFTAATADLDKLKILTSALGVSHKISKKSEDDLAYTVDHSGYVVLIDPNVQYAGLFFSDRDSVEAVARDLSNLVTQNSDE